MELLTQQTSQKTVEEEAAAAARETRREPPKEEENEDEEEEEEEDEDALLEEPTDLYNNQTNANIDDESDLKDEQFHSLDVNVNHMDLLHENDDLQQENNNNNNNNNNNENECPLDDDHDDQLQQNEEEGLYDDVMTDANGGAGGNVTLNISASDSINPSLTGLLQQTGGLGVNNTDAKVSQKSAITSSSTTPITTTTTTTTSTTTTSSHSHNYIKRVSCYIGNLTWWTQDKHLHEAIGQEPLNVADLLEIKFYENKINGQSKGFCLCTVGSDASFRTIMDKLPKREINGQAPVCTHFSRHFFNQFEEQARKDMANSAGGGGGQSQGGGGSNSNNNGNVPLGDNHHHISSSHVGHHGGIGLVNHHHQHHHHNHNNSYINNNNNNNSQHHHSQNSNGISQLNASNGVVLTGPNQFMNRSSRSYTTSTNNGLGNGIMPPTLSSSGSQMRPQNNANFQINRPLGGGLVGQFPNQSRLSGGGGGSILGLSGPGNNGVTRPNVYGGQNGVGFNNRGINLSQTQNQTSLMGNRPPFSSGQQSSGNGGGGGSPMRPQAHLSNMVNMTTPQQNNLGMSLLSNPSQRLAPGTSSQINQNPLIQQQQQQQQQHQRNNNDWSLNPQQQSQQSFNSLPGPINNNNSGLSLPISQNHHQQQQQQQQQQPSPQNQQLINGLQQNTLIYQQQQQQQQRQVVGNLTSQSTQFLSSNNNLLAPRNPPAQNSNLFQQQTYGVLQANSQTAQMHQNAANIMPQQGLASLSNLQQVGQQLQGMQDIYRDQHQHHHQQQQQQQHLHKLSSNGAPPHMQQQQNVADLEFHEALEKNRIVSSSAISRAVQDASLGHFASSIETLVTAISLIKQSKCAHDERCKLFISSLQDTKKGIEEKYYQLTAMANQSQTGVIVSHHRGGVSSNSIDLLLPPSSHHHHQHHLQQQQQQPHHHHHRESRGNSRDRERERERDRDRDRDRTDRQVILTDNSRLIMPEGGGGGGGRKRQSSRSRSNSRHRSTRIRGSGETTTTTTSSRDRETSAAAAAVSAAASSRSGTSSSRSKKSSHHHRTDRSRSRDHQVREQRSERTDRNRGGERDRDRVAILEIDDDYYEHEHAMIAAGMAEQSSSRYHHRSSRH
jgi:hypothetical protein